MGARRREWRVEGEASTAARKVCCLNCPPSLIRNNPLLGPYGKTMSRTLWWSWGGAGCLPPGVEGGGGGIHGYSQGVIP